ncbi:hypothetical protein SAMN05443634_10890 [Chishuiella changwenlii]|uniref:Uncharacterized protein n=1 Tax=Chishuiella changwenlii TaxID=1434701 RepID=A0A1M6ZXM0_9FLAO|nr:hypothetical protein [Chishuiella changwenlii]GGE92212.1 hypothetical protein GCM10010984_07360 [Chishuiella changwenlii]SHL35268.1 hypothetical protein SAMN05443634_10890 [Chishuiella changwenlii]
MKKKFKKELNKYSLWILIGTALPLIIYLFVFGLNGLSLKNTNWSDFGSFIGGYATLIFGAANLYFLIKISYKLSQIDEDRNNKNKIDSVKPLGIINYEVDYKNLCYKVVINNFGLGPLVVKNYSIKYDEILYENFEFFYNKIALIMQSSQLLKSIEKDKFFVGSNSNYVILEVGFNRKYEPGLKNLSGTGKKDLNEFIKNMKSVELTFECEDIFGNVTELLVN